MKDAVSLPGVSLHHLLLESIERGAELSSTCKEAYEILKPAAVDGQSRVFTRYHEMGVTHRVKEPRVRKRIIGYDVNALYLSRMLRGMPCGKEQVVYYQNSEGKNAKLVTERVGAGF